MESARTASIFQRPAGRHWCFPDWTDCDGSVVFDRNSGDFWIVAPIAGAVLRSLDKHGPQTLPELVGVVRSQSSVAPSSALVEIVIDELVEKGLVAAAVR